MVAISKRFELDSCNFEAKKRRCQNVNLSKNEVIVKCFSVKYFPNIFCCCDNRNMEGRTGGEDMWQIGTLPFAGADVLSAPLKTLNYR